MAGQLVPDKDPIKTYDARWEVTDHNPAEILRLCAGRQRQGFRRFTRTPWAFPRTSMPSIIVGYSECLPTLAERASFSQVVRGIFGIRAASRRGHQGCSPGETRGPIAPLARRFLRILTHFPLHLHAIWWKLPTDGPPAERDPRSFLT